MVRIDRTDEMLFEPRFEGDEGVRLVGISVVRAFLKERTASAKALR